MEEHATSRDRRKSPRGLFARLAINIPVALLIVAVVLHHFGAIQTLRVSSVNMVPTLEPEDRVMVRAYGRAPTLGDVVVYASPFDREHLQVGRIVGVSGHKVELTDEGLRLDGETVSTPLVAGCDQPLCEGRPGKPEDGGSCEVSSLSTLCLIGTETLGERSFYTRRVVGFAGLQFPAVTVPEEHYFILSDNRVDERDSRIYGTIPHHAVVGVLSFVYYAFDESGIRWDRLSRPVS